MIESSTRVPIRSCEWRPRSGAFVLLPLQEPSRGATPAVVTIVIEIGADDMPRSSRPLRMTGFKSGLRNVIVLLSPWSISCHVSQEQYASGRFLLLLALVVLAAGLLGLERFEAAAADQPTLVIVNNGREQRFTADELLARPDTSTVSVSGDIYHHAVPYRAVPLLSLLGSPSDGHLDTLEAQANDGFISEIPLELVSRGASGGAVAWLAVEDPAHPWPQLPRERSSAGPFYLIWEHPERSGVTREQWPYKLARLSQVESADHRWPQLSVPASASNDATIKRGHDVFLVQCLPCHRLNGGGASEMGPDLGQPMSPTQYLTEEGLRALIRNPRAVRTWPGQQMIGFSNAIITDSDLDALMAYLRAEAESKVDTKAPSAAHPN
jgi:mono/diheme cytochrome c family protein